MPDFNDKVVVITGGATGIGFSFAKCFGADGAKVVVAEMRQERIDQAVSDLNELGYQASGFVCDVREREQVEALATHVWSLHEGCDVLLNNAGIGGKLGPVIDAAREDIDAVLAVNLFGVWNGVSVFGRRFCEQPSQSLILNVGSENSFFNAVPNNAPYIISKHAVFALTEALREEVPEHVSVGLIIPGWVQSEMSPFPMAMPTDEYTRIAYAQIKAGEFYIVSHPYNTVRISERQDEIAAAYEKYAPRYEGDQEHDVRTVLAARRAQKADHGSAANEEDG